MKHKTRIQTWLAALTVAAAAVTGLALAPPAGAVADVTVERLDGRDRFETAVAVAKAAYPTGARRVLVANGRDFPDALAGAALAGAVDGPLVLTERDALPTATSNGIRDLAPTTVYILGGTASVSAEVERSLAAPGRQVIRVAGDDRYETAAKIASTIGADRTADLDELRTAFVATGTGFADALAGGPVAAAGDGTDVHPILLVNADVPASTEAAIEELAIEQVVILGGTSAVSAAVEAELETLTGNDAVRLAGGDRYATAVAVARAAVADFGFTFEEVLLANGRVFADALAGGPLGGVRQAPVLLTEATSLPGPTRTILESESDIIETITVLGGTAAVSAQVADEADTAAESNPRPANESVRVKPLTRAEQANGTTREYTVTDLGSTPVDIVLVECGDVSISNGQTRFANVNTNAVADGTALAGSAPDLAAVANARISSVNGAARQSGDPSIPNDDYANNVAPVDGTVTFTIQGPASGSTAAVCVVPAVFVDSNVDNALNGTAANPTAPNEAFGTGGATSFTATGAAAGQFQAHTVQSTEKGADRFTGCRPGATPLSPQECVTFRYDANDAFQVDSSPVSLEQFELRLSAGDSVRGTYNAETSGQSTFNLTDAAPAAPTNVTTSSSGTGVEVSFTDSATPTVDLYRLYRANGTTCPDFNTPAGRSAYAAVAPATGTPNQGETADTGNANQAAVPPVAAPTYTIADRTAGASTTYCYVVVSVDREGSGDAGDESPGAASRVFVSDSTATSANNILDNGDVLRFVFSGPVAINNDGSVADNTGVTVEGGNTLPPGSEVDVTCGATPTSPTNVGATCTYDQATRVLTMTIVGVTTQQYPLTLVDVFRITPAVDLSRSDTEINDTSA